MMFNDNKPIYLQIAEGIMDRIQRGELAGGDRLPSVREYAAEAGVNPNTVMRTYTWLQTEGLINMKRGIGYFIDDNAPDKVKHMRYQEFFNNDFIRFLAKLSDFGVSPDELKLKYEQYLNAYL